MTKHARVTWVVVALLAFCSACTVLTDVDYEPPPNDRLFEGSGPIAGAGGVG
jgi:hypothetical protein